LKELSLNILDIAENSVKAKATLTEITILEKGNTLTLTIKDDGTGMPKEILEGVTNPFYTTRTTRKVGLGLPLLKMAAEQTGGGLEIESRQGENHGTTVTTIFYIDHIDFAPLGDVVSTMVTLIQGHPETDFLFNHIKNERAVKLDTRELRLVLGDVPLNKYEVIKWISEYLREQYENFN
jgi:anti-sigma regulatory factor (Ser/Thr protein kinase)